MITARLDTLHRRTAWLAVVAALLLAQTLGLLHRVAHAPAAGHAAQGAGVQQRLAEHAATSATAATRDHADHVDHADSSEHGLEALFGGHDADGCASYDQAAHSDLLWGGAPTPCVTAVNTAAATPECAGQPAAQAAGYLARGPPTLA